MRKQNLKNKNGITLIALVVTIVVLIILAVISINLAINSNIIGRAESAGDYWEKAEANELLRGIEVSRLSLEETVTAALRKINR